MSPLKLLLLLFCIGGTPWTLAGDCARAARLDEKAQALADPQAKAALLAEALALCPDANIGYRLAVARLEANDAQGALAALAQARESLDSSRPGAKRLLAAIEGRRSQAYLQQEDIPLALAHIEAAIDTEGSGELGWLWQVRKAVDLHPKRQQLDQAGISRSLVASRSIGAVQRIDLYILFDTDRDRPNAEGMAQARELGKALAGQAGAMGKALIIGHTDRRGGDAYNDDLSRRRAEQVTALIGQWHPELQGKLKAKGKGEAQPRHPGDSDEDYRLNRRVEVQLIQ